MGFLEKLLSVFDIHSNRNAFCIKDKFYTYKELRLLVAGIRKVIDERLSDEQKAGILVSDDIETYATILALLLSGKTYIPIHPHHPAERTDQIIKQSGIQFIFSNSKIHTYDGIEIISNAAIVAEPVPPIISVSEFPLADRNAYILFTSGSTGVPKGVPISYYNLNSFVDAFGALGYQLDENDRFLQMFDLTFDLSVMSYLIPLCVGACVYTVADTGTKYTNVYGVLEEHNITCALMVPSIITYLRPYFNEIHLPHMKYSMFCGEALYKDVVEEWRKCVSNATIENVYGPTEATIFCLTYTLDEQQPVEEYNGIVTLGKPMPGMEAMVTDENKKLLQDGEKGELCLFGKQVTAGYINQDKNREAFFELEGKKYYRTGDIAFKNKQGNFMYCGRADHQVKIQGFRVELNEIEFQLRNISGSPNVVVLAIGNKNGLNQVHAIFEEERNDTNEITEVLRTKVPDYMLPAAYHFISPFPLNANGKTDRNKLEKDIAQSV